MQVSGTNDNKKLYEWIKSQQIKSVKINCTSYLTFLQCWCSSVLCGYVSSFSEYGEVDSDKLAAAVDTFVRSCAGYSVATYVLVSLNTCS